MRKGLVGASPDFTQLLTHFPARPSHTETQALLEPRKHLPQRFFLYQLASQRQSKFKGLFLCPPWQLQAIPTVCHCPTRAPTMEEISWARHGSGHTPGPLPSQRRMPRIPRPVSERENCCPVPVARALPFSWITHFCLKETRGPGQCHLIGF